MFKAGDRVRCMDARDTNGRLRYGEIYTVATVTNADSVWLEEVRDCAFFSYPSMRLFFVLFLYRLSDWFNAFALRTAQRLPAPKLLTVIKDRARRLGLEVIVTPDPTSRVLDAVAQTVADTPKAERS